jgi:integrase
MRADDKADAPAIAGALVLRGEGLAGELVLRTLDDVDRAPPAIALGLVDAGALPRHPVAAYLVQLAPGSRRAMLSALEALARLATRGERGAFAFEWWALRFADTNQLRARALAEHAPGTVRKMLSALRGVLKACKRLELLEPHDYAAAIDLEKVKGSTEPRGRHLAVAERLALLDACAHDTSTKGVRDTAIVGTAIKVGARRGELMAADVTDYNKRGELRLRHTKGNKVRTVYLDGDAARALERWLELRGDAPGALFCPVPKGGCILTSRRLSAHRYYTMLLERARQAGLDEVTTHDLRKTFGGELLDAGADLATVALLLGHSNTSTTARYYDKRGAESRKRAARLMQVTINFPDAAD